jgi:hypothetical protein
VRYFVLYILFCFSCSHSIEAITADEVLKQKKDALRIGIVTAVPGESGKILESMQKPIVKSS